VRVLQLCIGCGICVKKCPFEAIQIINLPSNLTSETTHRYGPNSFKLHRLPMPRPGEVLGLVGTNGIGKSTALQILADKLKPNLGNFDAPPTWEEVLKYFRGSELQGYFTKLLDKKIKAIVKIQYVDAIPRAVKGGVGRLFSKADKRGVKEIMLRELQLDHLLDREVDVLSGGELQRFAIGIVAVQDAQVYMFDEPSSYLDIRQRLTAARVIRDVLAGDDATSKYVICVEHDLAVLDYLSDFICCLYGVPGAYGVVTMPFSVREGINIFLAGFIPTENMRFRDDELTFKVASVADAEASAMSEAAAASRATRTWPALTKTHTGKSGSKFILHVEPGSFADSEIIVLLGENGTGKTTFVNMLAGKEAADPAEEGEEPVSVHGFSVSYKPQKIAPTFEGSVMDLLMTRIPKAMGLAQFKTDVLNPMKIEAVKDQLVKNLSGGELQRVALAMTLGKPADVYLIDEPSAYLDSEQRIVAAKMIKRFILHSKKTGFVVGKRVVTLRYVRPPPLSRYVVCRARLYHGHVHGRPRHRLRRFPRNRVHRHGPPVAAHGHEQVPLPARDHVPARPHELPPPYQQAQQREGLGAEEGWHVLLHGRRRHVCSLIHLPPSLQCIDPSSSFLAMH
jgi:ATP-binding cassette, sub-family E, member 1